MSTPKLTYYDALGSTSKKYNTGVCNFNTQTYPGNGFKIVKILDITATEPIIELIGDKNVPIRLRVNPYTTSVYYPSESLSNSSRELTHNGVRLVDFLTKKETSAEDEIMYAKFITGKYDKITYTDYSRGKNDDGWKYTTETGVFIDYSTIDNMMRKQSETLTRTGDMLDDPTVWKEQIKDILTSDEEKAAATTSEAIVGGKRRSKSSNKPKKSAKRVRTAKRSKYRRTRRQRK
jgi:hypothetical protein